MNMTDDYRLFLANFMLERSTVTAHSSDITKRSAYLIMSKRFQEEIKKSRKVLRLNNAATFELNDFKELVGSGDGTTATAYARIDNEVYAILTSMGLPEHWTDFVNHYLLNSFATADTVSGSGNINVDKITDDNEITITIKPGLRRDEYDKAWQVLSPLLGTAESVHKPYAESERDIAMYADKTDNHMTYTELAKKYLANEYLLDREAARNRSKKIVDRVKQRVLQAGS